MPTSPTQCSWLAMLMIAIWGCYLGSVWVAMAGVMAHFYSVGLADWDESKDLANSFRRALERIS